MDWKALNKEIDVKQVLAFLAAHVRDFCALIALLFFLSPFIEMVVCLFDRVSRIYPLATYPVLDNDIILRACALLGAFACIGQLHRLREAKVPLSQKLRKNPMYVLFSLMVVWMVISTLVNHKPLLEVFGNSYRNEPFQLIVAYFLLYLFCGSFIRGPRREWLALASVLVSIPLGLYATIRYLMVSNGTAYSINPFAVAVFFNNNHYGYYIAIHILLSSGLFALSRRRWARVVALVALVENTMILSLNDTFGVWLASFMALIFQIVVLWIVQRRCDWRSPAALGVFLVVTFVMGFWTQNVFSSIIQFFFDLKSVLTDPKHSDSAGSIRWKIWKITVGKIAERPVFGFGNEGITQLLTEATGESRPHNEVLQYAAFYGIPAALLYVAGVLSVYLRAWKHRASLDSGTLVCLFGAAAYFASSMFGNTMFYTAPFFFLFLGMGYCTE